jgi:hypothetical protein
MHQHMMGPFWGNVAIIAVAGAITLACFAAMLRMLFRPGESDPKHPKRMIFGDDRRTGG